MNLKKMAIYPFIESNISEYQVLDFRKNEYIERSSAESGALYYTLEGEVQVESISSTGNAITIDVIPPGNFAGHISKLRGSSFLCDTYARTSCKVLRITYAQLDKLLENPEFARYFYYVTSERVYGMYKKMLVQKLYTQEEVVVYHILKHRKENVFVFKSKYKICEDLGVSRRGLYNIFNKLIERGYIEQRDGQYIILDLESLENIAENIIAHYQIDEHSIISGAFVLE